jgi:hypothetical protein
VSVAFGAAVEAHESSAEEWKMYAAPAQSVVSGQAPTKPVVPSAEIATALPRPDGELAGVLKVAMGAELEAHELSEFVWKT